MGGSVFCVAQCCAQATTTGSGMTRSGGTAYRAHLERNSVTVRPGDRVEAGVQIARCGNSGNSSEPHLHFQIMDRPWPTFAAGLPFRFTDGTEPPRTGELLTAGPAGAEGHTISV